MLRMVVYRVLLLLLVAVLLLLRLLLLSRVAGLCSAREAIEGSLLLLEMGRKIAMLLSSSGGRSGSYIMHVLCILCIVAIAVVGAGLLQIPILGTIVAISVRHRVRRSGRMVAIG